MNSKEIIKEADSILKNKKKFRHALIILIIICITIIAVSGLGFYTKAIQINFGSKNGECK